MSIILDEVVDHSNLSAAAAERLADGTFPPLPVISSLMWQPPKQSVPVVQATNAERMRLFANSDHHSWTEMVTDIPTSPPTQNAQLIDLWNGQAAPSYTMTLREYWTLVPGTYTQVSPGGGFQKSYTTSYGISSTDASSLAATLNVSVGNLGASITAEFSHSVTTDTQTTEHTGYTVGPPAEGFTRVWMLWQLWDEVCALDAAGNVISNPVMHGDVNWTDHAAGGAFLNYLNVDQLFPSTFLIPVQKDFQAAAA